MRTKASPRGLASAATLAETDRAEHRNSPTKGFLGGVVGMENLPFDLAAVDWMTVGIFSAIAFLAAVVGNAIAFGNRLMGAILTAVLFAVFFVAWTYWLQAMVMPAAPAASPVTTVP